MTNTLIQKMKLSDEETFQKQNRKTYFSNATIVSK